MSKNKRTVTAHLQMYFQQQSEKTIKNIPLAKSNSKQQLSDSRLTSREREYRQASFRNSADLHERRSYSVRDASQRHDHQRVHIFREQNMRGEEKFGSEDSERHRKSSLQMRPEKPAHLVHTSLKDKSEYQFSLKGYQNSIKKIKVTFVNGDKFDESEKLKKSQKDHYQFLQRKLKTSRFQAQEENPKQKVTKSNKLKDFYEKMIQPVQTHNIKIYKAPFLKNINLSPIKTFDQLSNFLQKKLKIFKVLQKPCHLHKLALNQLADNFLQIALNDQQLFEKTYFSCYKCQSENFETLKQQIIKHTHII